jgi:hypothetical protein
MVNAAMTDAHMTDALTSFQLQSPLYASAAMRAIMSDRGRLQRMLDFEAALARAEAAVGVITATAAVEIGDACRADFYHVPTLVEAAIPAGNIAIAVVNALTQQVARHNKSAATFVHWGAASQDVIDTALVLELRAAIDALLADLDLAIKGFTGLAGRHRRTQAVARTQLQHAATTWRCSLAARPARWRRWASTASASPSGLRRCLTCSFPTRPGTATATAWPRSRRCSAFSPAPAARSRAMSH